MSAHRCLGCMKIQQKQEQRCSSCGFCEQDSVASHLLQPGVLLHDRYYVGKAVKQDGEGITYFALDQKTKEAIYIREYMPSTLCGRQDQTGDIVINVGSQTQYKALQSDFIELYRQLVELRSLGNIVQVVDLFSSHNTVCAVYQYVEVMTLTHYIHEQAGELDWQLTSKLFRPFLESMFHIHQAGLVHRGISPETLVISNDRLILMDFSICALRMATSEIESQIYAGYAAPEQYSKMMHHGFWTDIYAISAVLYKSLSGTMPSESPTRAVNDNLISLNRLNDSVPEMVSMAIEQGMIYDTKARTQTIQQLMNQLYTNKENNTSTTIFHHSDIEPLLISSNNKSGSDADTIIYSDSKLEQESEETSSSMAPWKKTLIIMAPIVLVTLIIIAILIFGAGKNRTSDQDDSAFSDYFSQETSDLHQSELTSQSSESSLSQEVSQRVEQVTVDNFINRNYQDVVTDGAYKRKFSFSAEYDFSATYPKQGIVIDQNIPYGSKVDINTKIVLTVSKGPRYVDIPSKDQLASWNAINLKSELEKKYLNVQISTQIIYSTTIPIGNVVDIEGVLPGSQVDRANNEHVMVTLYVSAGKDPTAAE